MVVGDVFIESNLLSSLSIFPCSLSLSVALWEVWRVEAKGLYITLPD